MSDAISNNILEESASRVDTRLGWLHVRTVGSGPVAVLWPSMFVDGHTWDPVIPHLAATRRLIIVDPPGLGESDALKRKTSIGEAADAAKDLLRQLDVQEPVDWVGNAYGGHVGYKLARDKKLLRSLVAITAPPEANPPGLKAMTTALSLLVLVVGRVAPIRSAVAGKLLSEESLRNPRMVSAFSEGFCRPSRRSMVNNAWSMVAARKDVRDELADIEVPSLFIATDQRGDWSPEGARRAAKLTPSAKTAIIQGASTLVPLERPEELARAITGFWGGRF